MEALAASAHEQHRDVEIRRRFVQNPFNRRDDEYGLNFWRERFNRQTEHDNDIVLVAEMVAKSVFSDG